MGTVYILKNKINGKCYVGQTSRKFNERFSNHKKSTSYIGSALRKYGIDNFEKILIENVLEEQLDNLEKKYIIEYNSLAPNGYNFQDGGCKNKHQHEESKEKIGKANKGRKHTEEARKKMRWCSLFGTRYLKEQRTLYSYLR